MPRIVASMEMNMFFDRSRCTIPADSGSLLSVASDTLQIEVWAIAFR